MTLPEFLLARYAELEQVARGIPAAGWHAADMAAPRSDDEYAGMVVGAGWVLADIESKRRIVELHNPCDDWSYGDPAGCPELRALAEIHGAHPGFDERWRSEPAEPLDPVQSYRDEKRAYDRRLAEWLGLDPEVLLSITDGPTPRAAGLTVSWESVERQDAADHPGRVAGPRVASSFGVPDDGVRWQGRVHLNPQESDRMRAAVGPKPELLSRRQRTDLALMMMEEGRPWQRFWLNTWVSGDGEGGPDT